MISKKKNHYRYLFGPVHSRRLGISLGIDLVPHKTCTLNCVYCECGKTTCLTLERDEYVPTEEIINELDLFLSGAPKLDFITFSGAGEPTLHSGIGEVIDFIKSRFPEYRTALLTNGTLFSDPQVRTHVAAADVVIASLDAAAAGCFKRINRPHPGLNIDTIIDGLTAFQKEYQHRFFIEIFIVPGLNDTTEELNPIKTAIKKIGSDGVHLNTLDRPGTEHWVHPATRDSLRQIAGHLGDVGVIRLESGALEKGEPGEDMYQRILSTIKRRPCTARDLVNMFGLHQTQLQPFLDKFLKEGKIEKKEMERGVFYWARA
ncbi:MAG: radical SAM protein [Pseudomonadota bacterium]